MSNLKTHTNNYLEYCQYQKRLDPKTLKAYRIDLNRFALQIAASDVSDISPGILETYISGLHQQYCRPNAQHQRKYGLRDAAVIQLLFATGVRISELCSLKMNDINLY